MDKPNYTQVPNEFIDIIMSNIGGSSVKVFLAICRKTIGWHKDTDSISLTQLQEMTGISRNTLLDSINELGGLLVIDKKEGKTNKYTINFDQYQKLVRVPVPKTEPVPVPKTEHTKETPQKKDLKKCINTPLYHSIEKSFLSKNGDAFTNYGREGKAIHGLIEKAKVRLPNSPETFLLNMMNQFWKMKCNGDPFWHGQPFLPSTLNADGIWDRVLEKMRSIETTVDQVALSIAKGDIT